MKHPLGVIMLPMIFGNSLSFTMRAWSLRAREYPVRTVDLYKGQEFKRPFFLNVVGKNEKQNLDNLAKKFDDSVILGHILRAYQSLTASCERIALLGFGMGGVYALWYAERFAGIRGVIAWYPHLIFPYDFPKQRPHVEKINPPMIFFFGDKDDKIEPFTVVLSQKLSNDSQRIQTHIFPHAGHAFADVTVQGFFPNPLWRPKASWQSWKIALETLNLWSQ